MAVERLTYQEASCAPLNGFLMRFRREPTMAPKRIEALVLNSLTSMRGNAPSVDITIDRSSRKRRLIVFDPGRGMDDGPAALLTFGKGRGFLGDDPNGFGWGGSEAIAVLASDVQIHTIHDWGNGPEYQVAKANIDKMIDYEGGQSQTYPFVLSERRRIDRLPESIRREVPSQLLAAGHGTLVSMVLADVSPTSPIKRDVTAADLVKYLGKRFSPAIRSGIDIRVITKSARKPDAFELVRPWLTPPPDANRARVYVPGGIGERDVAIDVVSWYDQDVGSSDSQCYLAYGPFVITETMAPYGMAAPGVVTFATFSDAVIPYLTESKTQFSDDEFLKRVSKAIAPVVAPLVEAARTTQEQLRVRNIMGDLGSRVSRRLGQSAQVPDPLRRMLGLEPPKRIRTKRKYRFKKKGHQEVPEIVRQRGEEPDGHETAAIKPKRAQQSDNEGLITFSLQTDQQMKAELRRVLVIDGPVPAIECLLNIDQPVYQDISRLPKATMHKQVMGIFALDVSRKVLGSRALAEALVPPNIKTALFAQYERDREAAEAVFATYLASDFGPVA